MEEETKHNEVFEYLHANVYSDGFNKDQKRNLRKRAEKFRLENATVYFIGSGGKQQPKRWVAKRSEQLKILEACHSDKLASHFGRDKTRDKVSSFEFSRLILALL